MIYTRFIKVGRTIVYIGFTKVSHVYFLKFTQQREP